MQVRNDVILMFKDKKQTDFVTYRKTQLNCIVRKQPTGTKNAFIII